MKDERTEGGRRRDRRWLAGGMLVVSSVLLALAAHKPLWNNEFITLITVRLPWSEIVGERIRHNHMPGYFLALKAWAAVFGNSELSLRFISAAFGLASVVVVWRFAAWAWDENAGLAAGWLAALSEYLLDGASQARMYTVLHFLILLSMFLYARILRGARRGTWAAHLAVSLAGLSAHLLFGLALAVQAVHVFVVRRRAAPRTARVWALLAAPWLLGAPLLLYWLHVQYFMGQDPWKFPSAGAWMRHLLCCLWGDYEVDLFNRDLSRFVGFSLMAATVVYLPLAARGARRAMASSDLGTPSALTTTLLPWWFFFAGLLIYLSAFRTRDVLGSLRYYAVPVAAAPLVAVAAWRAIPRRVWRAVYLGAALALSGWYSMCFTLSPGSGLRQSVQWLAAQLGPHDGLVVCDRGPAEQAFAYYGHPEIVPVAVWKGEQAPEAILRLVNQATQGRSRLWALLYHEGRSPLIRVVGLANGPYQPEGLALQIGETRIFRYRVR